VFASSVVPVELSEPVVESSLPTTISEVDGDDEPVASTSPEPLVEETASEMTVGVIVTGPFV
jgi:hypothetical protein